MTRVSLAALAVLLALPASAQPTSRSASPVPSGSRAAVAPAQLQGLFAAGGTTATPSGSLRLGSSVGGVAPGRSTAGDLTLEGGFWYASSAASSCAPPGGTLPIVSTFDADAECWTAPTAQFLDWLSDGGGFIQGNEEGSPDVFVFEAPEAYLGQTADALYGGTLTFNLAVEVIDGTPVENPEVVLIFEGNRFAYEVEPVPTGSFQTYTVPLTEAGWLASDDTPVSRTAFTTLLGSFDALQIAASQTPIFDPEIVSLDSVVLSGPVSSGGMPPLYAEGPADDIRIGDGPFEVTIYAGTAEDSVTDLFGVAFDVDLSNALGDGTRRVSVVSARAPETDCTGDGQPDATVFQTFESGTPTDALAMAFSLRGDVCATGLDGRVPVAILTLTADLNGDQVLDLSAPTANDSQGAPLALGPQDLTLTLLPTLVVWPGDTDDSGLVDAQDLLPIGARFGVTGPARDAAEQGITWEAKTATPWPALSDTYIDANGDGTINNADVLAVGLNFGRTQTAPRPEATRPGVRSVASRGSARLGTEARGAEAGAVAAKGATEPLAEVVLAPQPVGTEIPVMVSASATDVLGAAALLALPAELEPVGAAASPLLDDGDVLDLWAAVPGGVDAAATRKRGAETLSGTGDLVVVTLRVASLMAGPATVGLSRLTLGTPSGSVPADPLSVSIGSAFAVAGQEAPVGVAFGLEAVSPNPTRGTAAIHLGMDSAASAARVSVFDALGREVAVLHEGPLGAGAHTVRLQSGTLAPGAYLVRVIAGERADVARLTVVR
ncbi:MAG: laminin B domain-containing protein [Bacteroidota bacterium]